MKPINLFLILILCAIQCLVPGGLNASQATTAPAAADYAGVLDPSLRSVTRHSLKLDSGEMAYTATAASVTVKDKQAGPIGRIFYIAYTARAADNASRPLTFVFNGGPGAASAYLHLGAMGPRRVLFNPDGTVPPTPARMADNAKSWLAFTDLVFVDPIGTGYSRAIPSDSGQAPATDAARKSMPPDNSSDAADVWGVAEDAETLARFIRTYLTVEERWLSPLFLAGESYGGFRAARLSILLQSQFGIAPSGLVLISPALDFGMLRGDERSLWPWVVLLPSYAAVAAVHGGDHDPAVDKNGFSSRSVPAEAEHFALSGYLSGLASGLFSRDWMDQTRRFTGLGPDVLQRWRGRIPPALYVKQLPADQHRVLSLYDGSIAMIDPNPTRQFAGGDLYLSRLKAPLTAAFNDYVRNSLDFQTDLPYLLLNADVFKAWNWRSGIQGQQGFAEAVADLKQAMTLNPGMHTMIVHGVYDLVTPYFASEIAIRQMDLHPEIRCNIQLKVYRGGHMPYLKSQVLDRLFSDAGRFYQSVP